MIVAGASPLYQELRAPAGEILSVAMPKPRSKGLDIVGEGGHLIIPDGSNANRGGLNLKGEFSTVIMDRMRIMMPPEFPADAIGLRGKSRYVSISNSRIVGIPGEQTKRHPDCVQVGDDAEIDTLEISDTTLATGYQALMAHATPGGKGLKTLILRRVNVRDMPGRKQLSIALLFGDLRHTGPKNAGYNIVLDNVWVDWPSEHHASQFPDGSMISGKIQFGVPPWGDFCPA